MARKKATRTKGFVQPVITITGDALRHYGIVRPPNWTPQWYTRKLTDIDKKVDVRSGVNITAKTSLAHAFANASKLRSN